MAVKQADPDAVSLDAAFAAAMGAPPKPKEPPAPAAIDPDAPHGRDDDGNPLEPYGRNKDGSIRKSPAGRPPKEDRARTGPAPSVPGKPDGKDTATPELAEPGQYAKELSDAADTIWFGLSALGKVGPSLPLVGKLVPGEKITAQAAVWMATKDRAVAAVSLAAEHNAAAARFARKLQGGNVTWAITCLSLVAPVLQLSGMVWAKNADEQLAGAGQKSVAELAAQNDLAMTAVIAQMTAQAELAAQAEVASMNGQAPA